MRTHAKEGQGEYMENVIEVQLQRWPKPAEAVGETGSSPALTDPSKNLVYRPLDVELGASTAMRCLVFAVLAAGSWDSVMPATQSIQGIAFIWQDHRKGHT